MRYGSERIPWVSEVFHARGGNFRCWPKPRAAKRAGHYNREIKIHVYSIRQTANVSGEFLRIENKQLKKVQNDSCGQNYHKTTYFCVEAINGERKIRGKLGHVVQIHVFRLA